MTFSGARVTINQPIRRNMHHENGTVDSKERAFLLTMANFCPFYLKNIMRILMLTVVRTIHYPYLLK